MNDLDRIIHEIGEVESEEKLIVFLLLIVIVIFSGILLKLTILRKLPP